MLTWFGKQPTQGAVVTFGVFDGVHRGHQFLLEQAKQQALATDEPLVAMTFDPHPLKTLRGQSPILLTTVARRVELLLAEGVDAVAVAHFDEAFSHIEAEDFIDNILFDECKATCIVESRFTRFGHNAKGSFEMLANDARFTVIEARMESDEGGVVSSTRLRALVTEGKIEKANELLGRPHSVEGMVIHGDARGRTLGYPTANLGINQPLAIPADGVYAGWLTVEGERWPAAISVGTNPTFEGHDRRVEAYALDRDDLELYDKEALVEFGWFLRPTLKFDGIEPLLKQMALDCDQARGLTST